MAASGRPRHPPVQLLSSGESDGKGEGWVRPAFSFSAQSEGWRGQGPSPTTEELGHPQPIPTAAVTLISESPFDEVPIPVCTPLLTGLFLPQLCTLIPRL